MTPLDIYRALKANTNTIADKVEEMFILMLDKQPIIEVGLSTGVYYYISELTIHCTDKCDDVCNNNYGASILERISFQVEGGCGYVDVWIKFYDRGTSIIVEELLKFFDWLEEMISKEGERIHLEIRQMYRDIMYRDIMRRK